jgi:hypothetical protein
MFDERSYHGLPGWVEESVKEVRSQTDMILKEFT